MDRVESLSSYRGLVVWQKAVDLVVEVYERTFDFPASELYGLTSQMRRASVSIPANLAEGHGRNSPGEYRQFIGHARGSLCELETHVIIAYRLRFLNQQQQDNLLGSMDQIGRMLTKLDLAIAKQISSRAYKRV